MSFDDRPRATIQSITITPVGVNGLDPECATIAIEAGGLGVKLSTILTADEVADPELLAAYGALLDLAIRRMREMAVRAMAVAP